MQTLADQFIPAWDFEAKGTVRLLKSLPVSKYDFRPDAAGRSMGELAWHLSEVDAYVSHGLETGQFQVDVRPPGIERPRTIEALAPGYERIHADAVARIRKLDPATFEKTMPFFDGSPMKVADILWGGLLHHLIHHRGELVLMCRLAGGTPPGLYGPTREEMAAFKKT